MNRPETMELLIDTDGTTRCIYGELLDLSGLGNIQIRRASSVEADAQGNWWADLAAVGGPRLGPYPKRSDALAAEVLWLRDQLSSVTTSIIQSGDPQSNLEASMNNANIRITIYRQQTADGPGPPYACLGDDKPEGDGWHINAKADLPAIENHPPQLLLLGRAFLIYSMYHAREPKYLAMAVENFRAAAMKLGYEIPLSTDHANWLTYGPEGLEPGTPDEYRALFKQISRTFGPAAAKQQASALGIEWPRQVSSSQMAELMKQEIIDDCLAGTVPVTVNSYGDLHDHVDANCYGGTEALLDELDDAAPDTDEGHWSAMQSLWEIATPAMDLVDAWIKSGGLRDAVEQRKTSYSS